MPEHGARIFDAPDAATKLTISSAYSRQRAEERGWGSGPAGSGIIPL